MHVRTTSSPRLFRAPQTDGAEQRFAMASIDISTGELITAICESTNVAGELARISPGEVLVGEDLSSDADIRAYIDQV